MQKGILVASINRFKPNPIGLITLINQYLLIVIKGCTISLSRHEQVCLSGLNMRTFTETIKLTDKKKLRNVTN